MVRFPGWFTALVVGAVGGCITAPPVVAPYPTAERQWVQAFQIEGRVAVRQGEQQSVATISWFHRASADSLDVVSPLGQTLARFTREPGRARLETAERQTMEAESLDVLSEQVFGVELPFSRVSDWVLGRYGNGQVLRHDQFARPVEVQAEGWRLRYLEYETTAVDALPTLMEFERGDIRMRLKVDQWTLP